MVEDTKALGLLVMFESNELLKPGCSDWLTSSCTGGIVVVSAILTSISGSGSGTAGTSGDGFDVLALSVDWTLTPMMDKKRSGVWVSGLVPAIEDINRAKKVIMNICKAIHKYLMRIREAREYLKSVHGPKYYLSGPSGQFCHLGPE